MARPAVIPASPANPGSRTASRSRATRTTASAAAKAQVTAKSKITKAPAKPKLTKASSKLEVSKPTKPTKKAPAKPRTTKTKPAPIQSTVFSEESDDELETLMKEEVTTLTPRARSVTNTMNSSVAEPKKRPGRPKSSTTTAPSTKKSETARKTPTTRQTIKTAINTAVPKMINAVTNAYNSRSNVLRSPTKKKTVRWAPSPSSTEGGSDKNIPIFDAPSAGFNASPIRRIATQSLSQSESDSEEDAGTENLVAINAPSIGLNASPMRRFVAKSPVQNTTEKNPLSPSLLSTVPQVNGLDKLASSPVKRINFSPKKASAMVDENGEEKLPISRSTILASPAKRAELSPSPSPFKYSIGRGSISREGANSAPVPQLNFSVCSPLKMSPRKALRGGLFKKSEDDISSTPLRSSLYASPAKKLSLIHKNSTIFSPRATSESSRKTDVEVPQTVESSDEDIFDSLFDTRSQDESLIKATNEDELNTSPETDVNDLLDGTPEANHTPIKSVNEVGLTTSPDSLDYGLNSLFPGTPNYHHAPVKATNEVDSTTSPESPEYGLDNLFPVTTEANNTPIKAAEEVEQTTPLESPEYGLNNLFPGTPKYHHAPIKPFRDFEPTTSPEFLDYGLKELFPSTPTADNTHIQAAEEAEPKASESPEYCLNNMFPGTPQAVEDAEQSTSPGCSFNSLFVDTPHFTKESGMKLREPSPTFDSRPIHFGTTPPRAGSVESRSNDGQTPNIDSSPIHYEPTPPIVRSVESNSDMEDYSSPLDNEPPHVSENVSLSPLSRPIARTQLNLSAKYKRVEDPSPYERHSKRKFSVMSPDLKPAQTPKRRRSEPWQTNPVRLTNKKRIERRRSEGWLPPHPSSAVFCSHETSKPQIPVAGNERVASNGDCYQEEPSPSERVSKRPSSVMSPDHNEVPSPRRSRSSSSQIDNKLKRLSSEIVSHDEPSPKRPRQADENQSAVNNISPLATPQVKARGKRRFSLPMGPLHGAIVFVDVHLSSGEDVSSSFEEALQRLGATVRKSWSWNPGTVTYTAGDMTPPRVGITHLVYKDGGIRTLEKARQAGGLVKCVRGTWVTDCEKAGEWLDESSYEVDTSELPRGGKRRQKSMVPEKITNVNGTLFYSNGTSTPKPKRRRSSKAPVVVTPRVPDYNFDNLDTLGMTPGPGTPGNRRLVQQSCPPKQSCQGLFPDGPLDLMDRDPHSTEWGADDANLSSIFHLI